MFLGEMRPPAKKAIPALCKLLDHPNSLVRAQAIYALGSLGIESKLILPCLEKRISSPENRVKEVPVKRIIKMPNGEINTSIVEYSVSSIGIDAIRKIRLSDTKNASEEKKRRQSQ